jgi:hypothetical protein
LYLTILLVTNLYYRLEVPPEVLPPSSDPSSLGAGYDDAGDAGGSAEPATLVLGSLFGTPTPLLVDALCAGVDAPGPGASGSGSETDPAVASDTSDSFSVGSSTPGTVLAG